MAAPVIPPPLQCPDIKYKQLFINNEFVHSASGKTFPTVNPATGGKICDVQEGDRADVDKAVNAAKAAFDPSSPWRKMTATDRGRILSKVADLMERDRVYAASLESLDNGKPYVASLFMDVPGCIEVLRYYAGWADKVSGRTYNTDANSFVYTRHEPVGVCGQIIRWNFPLCMFAWKVAPALACGNTVVLKPAEQTPLTAIYACSLFKEAGLPAGVLNVIPGNGPTAGAAISAHMDVNKLTFTGTTEVGQLVLQAAAKSNLKRVTLELGDKSPLIIFPDANLDEALDWAHQAIFMNMGQVCTAGSRLFVHEDIYDAFVKEAIVRANNRKIGDPFDLASQSGPQVDKEHFDKILGLIEKGESEGARMECGGGRLGDKGYFIQNTLFTDLLHRRQTRDDNCQGRDIRTGTVYYQVQGNRRSDPDGERYTVWPSSWPVHLQHRYIYPCRQRFAGGSCMGKHLPPSEYNSTVRRLQNVWIRTRTWRVYFVALHGSQNSPRKVEPACRVMC